MQWVKTWEGPALEIQDPHFWYSHNHYDDDGDDDKGDNYVDYDDYCNDDDICRCILHCTGHS